MAKKRDVLVRIGADDADFKRGMKGADDALDKLAGVGKKAGAALAAGFAAATAAVAALTAKGLQLGNELNTLAQRLGTTTGFVAEIGHVARRSGLQLSELESGFTKLAKRGPLEQQLNLYAERMAGLTTHTEKAQLASEVFGDKVGAKLIPLLSRGAAGIAKLRGEAQGLGITLDEVQRKNIADANAAIDKLKSAGDGAALQLASAFGPAIEGAANAIVWLTQKVVESLPKLQAMAERFLGIKAAADDLSDTALKESLLEQIKAMDALNNRIAEQRYLLEHSPGPSNERIMNDLLADQAQLQGRINELLAERVKRTRAAEEAAKSSAAGEVETRTKEELDALRKAAEEETKIEMMLFELFQGIEEQKKEIRQQEFDQMWTNLQAELEIYDQLDERRRESTQSWIDNLLIEVAELEKAEKAKKQMRDFSQKHFLSNLVSGSAALASANEKMFKLNQAAAVSQTIVDGIASAKAAFKNAGGYPWGIAAAAADAFDTAARVAAIKSTTFGSGTTPSAAGTPTVGGAPVATSPQQQAVHLQLNGEFFSGEAVRGLIDRINDAIGDGAKVLVT